MKLATKEIADIVDETIENLKNDPVDLLNTQDEIGELTYLQKSRASYLRTISDIVQFNPTYPRRRIKTLEIGAFLGVVSVCLAKLDFEVAVIDIPEFISNRNLQRKFRQYNVSFSEGNLRNYSLPYANDTFDVVVMCEVLEHLNFNPLPVIGEINRILKSGGLFYLSLPNLASLKNRIKLLIGKSIHNPIEDYFAQLDANRNMIVGIHWREYTSSEIKEMLQKMGFSVQKQRFSSYERQSSSFPMAIANNLIDRLVPGLKGNQTTLAIKIKNHEKKFYFTAATTLD